MKLIKLQQGLLAVLLLLSWPAQAALPASTSLPAPAAWTAQARESINQFLASHATLEGREYSVQWNDLKAEIPQCERSPRVALQGRDRVWGKVFLSLRCESGRTWVRPVSIYVEVKGRYLVAARALRKGQTLTPADWQWTEGDLSKLDDSAVIDDPERVKDMEVVRAVQSGNPLRLNDFRPMTVIRMGDQVRVTMLGRGFAIDASGQAMADAALGGTVKVRISEGKIVQGKAVSPGSVEVIIE